MKWLCVCVAIAGLLVALLVAPPLVFAASITVVDKEVGSVPLDATHVASSASGGSYSCVVPSGKGSYWMNNGERAGARAAWTPKGPKRTENYALCYTGESDDVICVDRAYSVARVPRSSELLVRVSLPYNLFEPSANPKLSPAIVRDHNIATLPSSFRLYMAAAGRYVYSISDQKMRATGTGLSSLLLYIDGKLLAKDEHFKLGMAADDGDGWVVVTSARFGSR